MKKLNTSFYPETKLFTLMFQKKKLMAKNK